MLPQFCRSLTVGLVHAELQEQVVDVGVGVARNGPTTATLLVSEVRAAEPVDLARVGRAHQPQQQVVAGGGVGRQVARLEVAARARCRRAACVQRTPVLS